MFKKMFGPESEKVRGHWRKLYKEERRNLYRSQNIFRVTISKRMKRVGNVEGVGENKHKC